MPAWSKFQHNPDLDQVRMNCWNIRKYSLMNSQGPRPMSALALLCQEIWTGSLQLPSIGQGSPQWYWHLKGPMDLAPTSEEPHCESSGTHRTLTAASVALVCCGGENVQRNATFKGKEPNTLDLHARPNQRRLCFRHSSVTGSWEAPLALIHSVLGMTHFISWKATNLLTFAGTTWDLLRPRFHVDAKSISIMDQRRLRLTPRITGCELQAVNFH